MLQIARLATRDTAVLHGTLLSLAALASATEAAAPADADTHKLKVGTRVTEFSVRYVR